MLKNIPKKIFILLLIISIVIFTYHKLFRFEKGQLEEIASQISYPILKFSAQIGDSIKERSTKKETILSLEQKLSEIQKQNEDLIAENTKLKSMLNFDYLTKELIEFQKRYNLNNAVLSKILIKNFGSNEQYFIIDKGTKDHIEESMIAIYKNQIIGRVSEVYENYSKILLVSDFNCKISAYAKESKAPGICQGINQKNKCELAYVSQTNTLTMDDLVISSGHGLIFPEGFSIGKIVDIKTKDLCLVAQLESLINFESIDYCLLIDRKIKNNS
ncbi:TPA: hypothetical protein DEO28_01610 [Candidatus Dependentiae bacterium]|nr:MAG: Cell shape-determining protein MreC [candidate division TM6 bacterium GW2011_GWE2_31_21]KKP52931.1 MAG: Cell shape-determining protein MreC [candidate division TM6 bacterium GW2011_GWF2_33_332]HBS47828.1 hypothetical protein [Candidatus Dependentiae bacterium]HBZ73196.1 hypothetical protein [Candidatus Dependentiae bacterium]